MSKPTLYIFAISHYCEKALWALEYLGIDHEVKFLAPGDHLKVAKKLGAKASSLPFLGVDGGVLQGSARIIDWADEVATGGRQLTPDTETDAWRAIEKRADDIIGVHTRRLYYSEALVDYPATVRPIFTHGLGFLPALMVRLKWPVITKIMIARMDLGPEQREDSRQIVEGELDWLDGILADGRSYLVGDRFSRADMAVASLMGPLATPPEHPTYAGLAVPPLLTADIADWADRPSLKWVRDIYRNHRPVMG